MSKYIPGNQKHLTLEDRKYIEKSLNAGCSFKDIARYLCKDPTTISKEIYGHHAPDFSGTVSISDYNESSRTRYVRENSVFLP